MRPALLLACLFALVATSAPAGAVPADVSACFTPAQSCVGMIVTAIDGATASIRVQAYGFSSLPILHALAKARGRGVDVQVILDKSDDRTGLAANYSGATYMAHEGVPVWIDAHPAIAHIKVLIIDGGAVITGSYNFTKAAELRNAENVLLIRKSPRSTWRTGRLGSQSRESTRRSDAAMR